MKPEMEKHIKKELYRSKEFPFSKKTTIACLTFEIINECSLEDLTYLNLGWVAWKLEVSQSYVTRCFKKIFGHPPLEQLKQRKMRLAYDLLVDRPDLSIREVAEKLDFCNVNYFIKVFKEKAEITPLRYRIRRLREKKYKDNLRNLAWAIQASINHTIRKVSKGKCLKAVNVHGGYGKLKRDRSVYSPEFLAPGFEYKDL
ncbi:MAG: helix-turn-helix transcriptional regulator [bacterium]|nr:helix-turn-helix transcriptional regulator [bacterium]